MMCTSRFVDTFFSISLRKPRYSCGVRKHEDRGLSPLLKLPTKSRTCCGAVFWALRHDRVWKPWTCFRGKSSAQNFLEQRPNKTRFRTHHWRTPKELGAVHCTSTEATSNLQSNTLQDSLHPILKKLEHVKSGFNIFRRFRITHLQTEGCPEVLRHFWRGHEPTHVEERYTKLLEKREYRLNWAERLGLGFDLNLGRLGRPENVIQFRRLA
jgi:hypothetical protein